MRDSIINVLMKALRIFAFLIAAFCSCSTSVFAQQLAAKFAPDHLIVNFKLAHPGWFQTGEERAQSTVPSSLDSLNQRFGALRAEYIGPHQDDSTSFQRVYVIKFAKPIDVLSAVKAYLATGLFTFVEPDYIGEGAGKKENSAESLLPSDPNFRKQWGLHNDGSFNIDGQIAVPGADIDMVDAWPIEQGDSSVIVAFVDSGCKLDHPEFAGRIWHNKKELAGNHIDDDKNGFADDVVGWNFQYGNNNPTDDFGHGTNVASIVGENGNNGVLFSGIDWRCKLMILKALDSNNAGSYSIWASAIYYAVDNGARVINLSLEGHGSSSALEAAITYAYNHNVLPVACMGNFNSAVPSYPAACTHAFGVGSVNSNDTRTHPFFWDPSSGSDWGSDIKVVAPGNYIYGLNHQSNTADNIYWGGTSQATPHVVGLAALLLAQMPGRTVDSLEAIIERTADDQVGNPSEDTKGWDQYYGYGRINAYKALRAGMSGVASETQSYATSISPNPASSFAKITTSPFSNANIEVADVSGRVLVRQDSRSGSITLDLHSLPNGVYFVRTSNGTTVEHQKLVVEH